jgi:hypothetical protein
MWLGHKVMELLLQEYFAREQGDAARVGRCLGDTPGGVNKQYSFPGKGKEQIVRVLERFDRICDWRTGVHLSSNVECNKRGNCNEKVPLWWLSFNLRGEDPL